MTSGMIKDRKAYTVEELEALLELAEDYNGSRPPTGLCRNLFRNKDEHYFTQVEKQNGGYMKPLLKDNSGDPRNPINGRLKGVFFSAAINPPDTSVYGPKRIRIDAEELMEEDCRLYFSDFCCYRPGGSHHVQFVLVPNKQVPRLRILKQLPELDIKDNPFIVIRSGRVYMTRKPKLWLEIFYTDSVDVRHLLNQGLAFYEYNEILGRGSAKLGGIPKNKNCQICNIRPGSVNIYKPKNIQGSPDQVDIWPSELPGPPTHYSTRSYDSYNVGLHHSAPKPRDQGIGGFQSSYRSYDQDFSQLFKPTYKQRDPGRPVPIPTHSSRQNVSRSLRGQMSSQRKPEPVPLYVPAPSSAPTPTRSSAVEQPCPKITLSGVREPIRVTASQDVILSIEPGPTRKKAQTGALRAVRNFFRNLFCCVGRRSSND